MFDMRKIFGAISLCLALTVMSASASDAVQIDVDRAQSLICITGTAEPNAAVTAVVAKDGDNLGDVADSESFNSNVNFITQKRAWASGKFKIVFKLKVPDDVGDYHIYVNSSGVSGEVEVCDVFYFNADASEKLASQVIAYTDAREVLDFLQTKSADILDLDMVYYVLLDDEEKFAVCKEIADLTEGNAASLQKAFLDATVVQKANGAETTAQLDEFLKIAEDNGLTEYICGVKKDNAWYGKLGKNIDKLKNRVIGCRPFDSAEEFCEKYRTSFALACIESLKNTFVKDIIKDFNDVLGVDISLMTSSNETTVCTALAGHSYADAASFRQAYQSAVSAASAPVTPSGGGGGGGSSSGRGGNSFSGSSGTPTIAVSGGESKPDTPQTAMPSDMDSTHYAYSAVRNLIAKGIVSGYPDGNFYPENGITRAELVKMIVTLYGSELPDSGANTVYTDVDADEWYSRYIVAATDAGIVNGIGEDTFGPDLPVTRQEAVTMIYRLAVKMNLSFAKVNEVSFADADMIDDYAREAVDVLSAAGVIGGIDGRFAPHEATNRGQCAKIINFVETVKGE